MENLAVHQNESTDGFFSYDKENNVTNIGEVVESYLDVFDVYSKQSDILMSMVNDGNKYTISDPIVLGEKEGFYTYSDMYEGDGLIDCVSFVGTTDSHIIIEFRDTKAEISGFETINIYNSITCETITLVNNDGDDHHETITVKQDNNVTTEYCSEDDGIYDRVKTISDEGVFMLTCDGNDCYIGETSIPQNLTIDVLNSDGTFKGVAEFMTVNVSESHTNYYTVDTLEAATAGNNALGNLVNSFLVWLGVKK